MLQQEEAINEVIYTERDFVRDMEYLRDVCVTFLVLLTSVLISGLDSASQRVRYHTEIPSGRFHRASILEHLRRDRVNTRLRDALNKRQKSCAVIECIADIFRDNVPLFAPFISYGAHHRERSRRQYDALVEYCL